MQLCDVEPDGAWVRKRSGGRRWHCAAALLVTALLGTGCGNEAREQQTTLQIAEMMQTLTADSVVHLASGDTLRISAATVAFYRGRQWESAWSGSRRSLAQGAALHAAIGSAWEDGLPPSRYRHDVTSAVLNRIDVRGDSALTASLRVHHLADLDILLTEGFNRLALDMVAGMLNPVRAGLDFRIASEEAPDATILHRVVDGEAPTAIVVGLRPTNPQYERMRGALLAFHQVEATGAWPRLSADAALKEGGRGEMVSVLRQRFITGVDAQEAALARKGAADPSLFDADLKLAVQQFQERHAIVPDGAVGPGTAKELNHTLAERIAELQLNLDRWRWLPKDLGGRYVLVNVAGFELEVVDQGRVIESMNVVVGEQSTETPIFSDSIRFVVVNPCWNVPDGIMERKIRPAMALDPGYLEKHDMEVVKGRVRQRPGPQNSLGRYKFIFPNDLDIYLHDTPDDHLFARTERAFSSGCVRIERPRDFARLLLRLQSNHDPDSLEGILASGSEKWLKLDRPLPVYLLYFTAWAQDDGRIRFHHDVYGRSEAMDGQAEEMKSPSAPPAVRTSRGTVSREANRSAR
ncbi:L,D-transpeptidase family protein [soil metagenome]